MQRLAVIVPSHEPHLPLWTEFIDSLIASEVEHALLTGGCVSRVRALTHVPLHTPHLQAFADPAVRCDFRPRYHTIISTAVEADRFSDRLTKALHGHAAVLRQRFHINTLHEALALSNASVGATANATEAFVERLGTVRHAKNWVQSLKKLHGCAAFASGPGAACFLVDSESRALRNGACHAASLYFDRKAVFVVPVAAPLTPERMALLSTEMAGQANQSLAILRPGVRASLASAPALLQSFYAMSVYHWFFEAHEVRAFMEEGLVAPLATMALDEGNFGGTRPFVEEAFYHYAAAQPSWGYHFVDVVAALEPHIVALTPSHRSNPVLEDVFRYLSSGFTGPAAERLAAEEALTELFVRNRVLVSRCPAWPFRLVPAFERFMRILDLCVSQSPDGAKFNGAHTNLTWGRRLGLAL